MVLLLEKKRTSIISLLGSLFLLVSMLCVAFASSGNWVEVARFTGASYDYTHKTESFTCNHTEWRIIWGYEPIRPYFMKRIRVFVKKP